MFKNLMAENAYLPTSASVRGPESALLKLPPVMIMDELTTALDLYYKESIRQWMKQYLAGNGMIIMTTHDEPEIAGGDISGCVLLFAVKLFMILVSGIWIHGDYMPEVLQRISGFMPLKWWENFTMQIFYGEWTWGYALGLCAVSAVAAVVGGGTSDERGARQVRMRLCI